MREEKRRERHERLVVAAMKLFSRFGYRKTSLDDVASEAGISKATFYHYFTGKDELIGEVFGRYYHEYADRLRRELAVVKGPAEKLRRYGQVVHGYHRSVAERSALSVQERLDQFPMVHKHLALFAEIEKETISAVLEYGIAEGSFRKMDVPAVTLLLLHVFKGVIAEGMRAQDGREDLVDRFLDVVLEGLMVPGHNSRGGK